MKVQVVVGMHFGDEGKGLVTDYLCSNLSREEKKRAMVVRYCGGANAGHTVVTPEGKRHVFSHFGSGTLQDVPTFWSKDAISNPVLFNKEYDELVSMGIMPEIYIDPESVVTTPIDMIVNQMEERQRGEGRHGSCGVGIHKTVVREKDGLHLNVGMLNSMVYDDLFIIPNIRSFIEKQVIYYHLMNIYTSKDIEFISNKFYKEVMSFIQSIKINSFENIKKINDIFIFESSQGLRLSSNRVEDGFDGKYLTESVVDLTNINKMLPKDHKLYVYGVSRCYVTRHGNGPMPNETMASPFPNLRENTIKETTNVTNEWQGVFRYGIMTKELMEESFAFLKKNNNLPTEYEVVITCLDHFNNEEIVKGIDFALSLAPKDCQTVMGCWGDTHQHISLLLDNPKV